MLCTFSFGFFLQKSLSCNDKKKWPKAEKTLLFSMLVCFYCKTDLSCFIVIKFKPGLEVPVFSGNICTVGVPWSGGTFFAATCCLLKEN